MAHDTNTQISPESDAKWRLGILLTSPFSFIGRQVIKGVNNLGAATIFLYLALIKTFRSKQLPKTVQQLFSQGFLHRDRDQQNRNIFYYVSKT